MLIVLIVFDQPLSIQFSAHDPRFPGDEPPSLGREPVPSRATRTSKPPKSAPASRSRAATKGTKAPSGAGRRVQTETYSSQVLIEDFVDSWMWE